MYHYLFGPVPSRRLGISLGVDLVTHKICTLDCLYCECGKTTELTLERKEYVPFEAVIGELSHYFDHHPDPDYITFSGSGEPTLNVHIGDVIAFIKKRKPSISVAVLTNGTLLSQPEVRHSLLKADLVMPSLDAARLSSFRKVNRPHDHLDLTRYIEGLVEFTREYRDYRKGRETETSGNVGKGKIALEVLILPGVNDAFEDLTALKEACRRIKPDVIQLNTLDRPGAVSEIHAATFHDLKQIQSFLEEDDFLDEESVPDKERGGQRPNVKVEIIAAAPDRKAIHSYREDLESAIIETIHRRPCTVPDLASVLGSHVNEINKYISTLEQNGLITSVRQERGVFYHSVKVLKGPHENDA